MNIKRTEIEDRFEHLHLTNSFLPKLFCPTCEVGLLIWDSKPKSRENAFTQRHKDHLNFDYENYALVFSGILKCNNPSCNEPVAVSGEAYIERDYSQDLEPYLEYRPHYFNPHLKLFNIPQHIPSNITRLLNESFKLYFYDSDSCGNKIRSAVECLLEEKGIAGKTGKGKFIALANRITTFNNNNPEYENLLDAIKFLGNHASHGVDGLKKKDTLEAYIIIEKVLKLAFPIQEDDSHIFKIASSIVAAEGPVK